MRPRDSRPAPPSERKREMDSRHHAAAVSRLVNIDAECGFLRRNPQRMHVEQNLSSIGVDRPHRIVRPRHRRPLLLIACVVEIEIHPDAREIDDAVDSAVGTPYGELIVGRHRGVARRHIVVSGSPGIELLVIEHVIRSGLALQVTAQHQRVMRHQSGQVNAAVQREDAPETAPERSRHRRKAQRKKAKLI